MAQAPTPSDFPVIRGRPIRTDEGNLICLTDIWKAAGYSKYQSPGDWYRLPMTTKLHEAVLERITGKSRNWAKTEYRSVFYAKTGPNGGTYADVRLALAYAEYLNPKLALEVKEVFLRYKAADPALADDILERAGPEANEWAGMRALGRGTRTRYTGALKDHGAKGKDFGICTNAVYLGLFDQTAQQLKAAKGAVTSLRDKMDTGELAYVMASEALATERIEDQDCNGGHECLVATSKSAGFIRQAIEADRRDRRAQPTLV